MFIDVFIESNISILSVLIRREKIDHLRTEVK